MKLPPWMLPLSSADLLEQRRPCHGQAAVDLPCTIIGLMMLPQSSMATNLRIFTWPVPRSMSTTRMWLPKGKVRLGGS